MNQRFPWVTATFAAAGLAATISPESGELFQYDRTAVEAGETWRIVTGQLAHWTPRMVAADLLVAIAAAAWLESRSRGVLAWVLAASCVFAGIAIHAGAAEPALYRGSSGIASGLFVAAALDVAMSTTRRGVRLTALAALLLFAAKIAWENLTGQALFAGQLPAGVTVLPAVHFAGAFAGGAFFLVLRDP